MLYLAIYPDDPNAAFNAAFFQSAPSILGDLMPKAAELGDLIRVVDVARAARGLLAHIVADAQNQRAICYLG